MNHHFPVGIHAGPGGNLNGVGQPDGYWVQLAKAGKKPVVMSVDNYGPIGEALRWCDDYGVEGVFTYRILERRFNNGWQPDIPAWGHGAVAAGEWQAKNIIESLPQEFDKRVWIQSWNEADKDSHWQTGDEGWSSGNASWFGFTAVACAQYLNARGYKMLAFAFSSGEPEILDWYTDGMKAYLNYCNNNLDQAGIALHEYSYVEEMPGTNTGLIGRYKHLHRICDAMGIARPKIRITEFGWTHNWAPSWQQGMADIVTVVDTFYGNHPNIDSVNIWYSGPGYNKIANKIQPYFTPLTQAALQWTLEISGEDPEEPPPLPPPEPPTGRIDMAKYFLPAHGAEFGPIYMLTNNWGAGPERVQLQRNKQWSYVTKNRNWERRFIGKEKIYLQVDTSPNEDEFYTVEADMWMPRYMKPGEAFTRNELTTYYNKNTCIKGTQVNWTSLIGFDKLIDIEEHNLKDVAVLQWIFQGELEETYYFAPHVGLVGWVKNSGTSKSWISEFVPSHEQPNERGVWCPTITREQVPEGETEMPEEPEEPPTTKEYPFGVDISRYQKDIDPVAMAKSGVKFCYIRSGQGRYLEDGFHKPNTQALLTYTNMLVGTYHMFQPNHDAASQAELWITLMRETEEQNLPPALDLENLEEFDIPTGDPQVYRDNVKLILEMVEDQTGIKPFIYTNVGWYNKYLAPEAVRFDEYGLWIANWTLLGIPSIPAGRDTWDFWQYGIETPGSDYGVQSLGVDANRANFATLADLQVKWGDNWLEKTPAHPPQTYPTHRRVDYPRTVYLLLKEKLAEWELDAIWKDAQIKGRSVIFSHDDAGSSANSHNHIIMYGVQTKLDQLAQSAWFKSHYPWAYVTFNSAEAVVATAATENGSHTDF